MLRFLLLLIAIFAVAKCQTNETTSHSFEPSIANNNTEPTTSPNVTTSSTTTPKPTTAPPTSTTPPTPTPNPSWSGNVTKDNTTCIIIKFIAKISIKYNTSNTNETTIPFNVPDDASVNEDKSSCGNTTQAIYIDFISPVGLGHASFELMLTFNKSEDNIFVEKIGLTFNLTNTSFPDYIDPTQYNKIVTLDKNDLNLFSVSKSHSYLCVDAQTASLDSAKDVKGLDAQISFTDSQVEAFIENGSGKFDHEVNCKSTEINDVVPIAVGAALAGLVIIVLIAYFIGRRRSRRLAYQSV